MSVFNSSMGIEPLRLREAFERARPEMLLLKESELLPINVDPLGSVSTVRGALPGLLAMRPIIEYAFREFDITKLDRLELYAFALTHAQAVFQGVSRRSRTLLNLSSEAVSVRGRLLQDVLALVQRGQIAESRLSELRGIKGYRNIANDLLILVTLLRESWPDVVGKTGVTLDELTRAESLGNNLVGAIGMRTQRPALAAEAAADRQRAYTLFMRAYNQVRRAVTFLRWDDGDIERIAPSLYTKTQKGRKRSRKRAAKETQPANESTTYGQVNASNAPNAPNAFNATATCSQVVGA